MSGGISSNRLRRHVICICNGWRISVPIFFVESKQHYNNNECKSRKNYYPFPRHCSMNFLSGGLTVIKRVYGVVITITVIRSIGGFFIVLVIVLCFFIWI